MKLLIHSSQNHQLPRSKPLPLALSAANAALISNSPIATAAASCYEQTSVPSPAASCARPSDSTAGFTPLPDDPSSGLLPVDEWDSMLWSLDEKDDPAPDLEGIPHFAPPAPNRNPLPPFPPSDACFDPSSHFDLPADQISPPQPYPFDRTHVSQLENPCFDRLQLDQLIRAAECVDSNDLSLAHAILARLNQQFLFPAGKALQRAAFYFKEALEALLLRSPSTTGPFDTVWKIGAYKSFSEILPIFHFANLTANQAILESLDGSATIHAVDFDIGLGDQWPPLMREIAARFKDSPRVVCPPSMRITAIVEEESLETKLAGDVLRGLGRELGFRFQIDFVLLEAFQTMALRAVRLVEGEAVVVSLTPSIFRRLDGPDASGLFMALRQMSPRIAVFIDPECRRDGGGTPSFRRSFIDGLELFWTMLDSLDAAAAIGGDTEQLRRIERLLLRPRILRSVASSCSSRSPTQWRELFAGAGLSPVPFSELAESQAACLLSRVPFGGFHVAKRVSSMLLCWQGREIVATSAWRFF